MRGLPSKRHREADDEVAEDGVTKKQKMSSPLASQSPDTHCTETRTSTPPTSRALPLTRENLRLLATSVRGQKSSGCTREPTPIPSNFDEAEEPTRRVNPQPSTPSPMRNPSPSSPATRDTLPWLRSGRHFSHPLVVEAATIQISSMSEFAFVPREVVVPSEFGHSSQATVADLSQPSTLTASQPCTEPSFSLLQQRSQASTSAPRTPQRQEAAAARRYRYTGSQHVPTWYAEVFESDGYDSESLALIATPPPSTGDADADTPRLPARRLILSTASTSPSVAVVSTTPLASAQDEWRPEVWPPGVERIQEIYNPHHWKFPDVSAGVRGGVGCGCEFRCNASSCWNAKCGRFCTAYNCSFAGTCGNSLQESSALSISRNLRTGMRGVTAHESIPGGEIVGEYFGRLDLFSRPCKNGPTYEGYRMHLKTKTTGNKFVGIDALEAGGMMRLLNHSCNPSARFHEVQTGRQLSVVAVTARDVYPGEEVTISYGDKLWFLCRCGWWGCQHRDLQHLEDHNARED